VRGKDDDLITWWEGLPSGERSLALKRILRAHLNPGTTSASPADQLTADVAWLRAAIHQLTKQAPLSALRRESPQQSGLSEDETQRRAHKIAGTRW